jgi:alpha-maltose-1-phosphate synthase
MALPKEMVPRSVAEFLTRMSPRVPNRLVTGVPPSRLLSAPLAEMIFRWGRRWTADRLTTTASWYDVMFTMHDAMVAAAPWSRSVTAVYAYEDAALATFRKAGTRGVRRLYDLPIIHYAMVEDIIRAEMERLPEAEPHRRVAEPPWKKHRKDAELQLADAVFVASRFTKESVMAAGVPGDRVEVIPYGYPTDVFDCRTAPPTGPFTVLSVGTQDLRKGAPYLLEAWRRAALPNARLRLVGGMRLSERFLAPYRGRFEHVPGVPRTHLQLEYQHADLLAFPTLGDGFGLVLQEAMSCGTPVVTTRCGGGPECIDDGVDGFLVPERDADALAEVFVQAYRRRQDLFEMGQAARRRAQQYSPSMAGMATAQAVLRHAGIGHHQTESAHA